MMMIHVKLDELAHFTIILTLPKLVYFNTNRALQVIHLDVWTNNVAFIGECHYYVSFIDDHTMKLWVYLIKHKVNFSATSKPLSLWLRRKRECR